MSKNDVSMCPFWSPVLSIPRGRSINAEVWSATWWMRLFGGGSPKRHIMYSNSEHVTALSLSGRLTGWKKEINAHAKPTRSYTNKKGEKKFVGTKFLKGTEILG